MNATGSSSTRSEPTAKRDPHEPLKGHVKDSATTRTRETLGVGLVPRPFLLSLVKRARSSRRLLLGRLAEPAAPAPSPLRSEIRTRPPRFQTGKGESTPL